MSEAVGGRYIIDSDHDVAKESPDLKFSSRTLPAILSSCSSPLKQHSRRRGQLDFQLQCLIPCLQAE
jgi:hypothetical protein